MSVSPANQLVTLGGGKLVVCVRQQVSAALRNLSLFSAASHRLFCARQTAMDERASLCVLDRRARVHCDT